LIESRKNRLVQLCASLNDRKARVKEDLFVAEGMTLLSDFSSAALWPQMIFLSTDSLLNREEIDALLQNCNCKRYRVLPHVFEKMTTEKGSQGVVALYSLSALRGAVPLKRTRRLIALEEVQDPGNVGTVLRTAAAFGFDGVLTVGGADPFGIKTVRASMGALCRIPVLSFPHTDALFSFLEKEGVSSVAACLHSQALSAGDCPLSEPVCLWIGNEGKGLSQEAIRRAQFRCVIPMDRMESLNAAVAAAVLMWEVKRRADDE
jgi:TrmH family RNA methyltransferase